jgi:hypothetical protein
MERGSQPFAARESGEVEIVGDHVRKEWREVGDDDVA